MALQVTVLPPALVLAAGFLGGMAGGLYFLSQAPFMMSASTPENRTLLFSLNFGFVTLAGSVGALFAGQLPGLFGERLGVPPGSAEAYQAVLLASVALSTLTLVPLLLIREESPPAPQPLNKLSTLDSRISTHPTDQETDFSERMDAPRLRQEKTETSSQKTKLRRVLSQSITWKISLPNLLIGFGAAILIPYMNVFLRERYALTDSTLGVLFSLSALLTGIGSIVGPRLAGNLGSKIRAVVLTQGLSLAFLLLLGFSPLPALAAFAFLMRGTLMNMAVPLYSAFSMEQVPESQQGTVNSVKELAWQMGWAVGPYLSGRVQSTAGFTPLFVITSFMYAMAISLAWLFFRNSEAAPAVSLGIDAVEAAGD
jgi:predicted MFS family arabinose efflux permease